MDWVESASTADLKTTANKWLSSGILLFVEPQPDYTAGESMVIAVSYRMWVTYHNLTT